MKWTFTGRSGNAQTMGAPRLWSIGWMILCLAVGLELLVVVSVFWALMVVVAWFAGQFVLVSLTLWDPDWDLVMQSYMTQRSHDFLDAG